MFTKTSWVHTTRGPQTVEDLIDIPHYNLSRNWKEREAIQGFTSTGLQRTVQISAQGHEVTVGEDQGVYLTAEIVIPAHKVTSNHEIQVFPTERVWEGFGTFEEGEHFGRILQMKSWKEVLQYFIDINFNVTYSTWILTDRNFHDSRFERASSDFYDGFFKTFVLERVLENEVFVVPSKELEIAPRKLLRMMLRRGLFAFQNSRGEIILPSNTLKQLIVSTGSHDSEIAQKHWNQVSNVPQPVSYITNVDSVTEGVPQELYEVRNLGSGSAIEVNGFQMATEP